MEFIIGALRFALFLFMIVLFARGGIDGLLQGKVGRNV